MRRFNPKPCPKPGKGAHAWFFHAACCAIRAGMSNEEAIEKITALASREPRPNEIEDALAAARGGRRSSAPRWSKPNPALMARVAKDGRTLSDLIARSPHPIWLGQRRQTEEILDALFPGNPLLCLGASKEKAFTAPREAFRGMESQFCLIVPSPMSAKEGRNKKGEISSRCLANTGPRRFIIIEFDHAPLDQQTALLLHLASYAPLALVVFSGKRSIHGWFFCEGQPEDKLKRFFDYAVSLGADDALWTRCQFSRLPDGIRPGATGEALDAVGVTRVQAGRQAVLYFNPEVIR
jgi:hypothetical protein